LFGEREGALEGAYVDGDGLLFFLLPLRDGLVVLMVEVVLPLLRKT